MIRRAVEMRLPTREQGRFHGTRPEAKGAGQAPRAKIAVLWKQIGPYHVARLHALREIAAFEVVGVELSHQEAVRAWQIPERLATSYVTVTPELYEQLNEHDLSREVLAALTKLNPDAIVVAGYALRPMRAAARWAREQGRVCVLMSASHWRDQPRLILKEWFKSVWLRRTYDAAFVGGERAAAYLERLHFPRSRVWKGYDVVDNDGFTVAAAKARTEGDRLRLKVGVPERYFLYVGRFTPVKNLPRLLDAYAEYQHRVGDAAWGLVMVGSGPEEEQLKRRAEALHLHAVVWPGFQQLDTLPAYYALANCLVLPSTSEPWGLVINEAMACGLPVLASDRCGAVGDLVLPGLNGYVFDPYDIDELAGYMERVSSGRVDLRRMGEMSRGIVANYTPQTWAAALADCLQVTLARRERGGR
ncbi:MAG: glycosyltransferase family 4 protein [Candidatus Tectomicrobia bacterium]|nr:glycosyltransferase family 4 protein [Candidatus Tectomicrobia bacterium]